MARTVLRFDEHPEDRFPETVQIRPDNDPYIASPFCPTCGHATALRVSPEWLLAHFQGVFADTLAVLIEARMMNETIIDKELARLVYLHRDQADLPVDPIRQIGAEVSRNRQKLAALGWWIMGPSETNIGFRLLALEHHDTRSPYSRLRKRTTGGARKHKSAPLDPYVD